jgi:hypothetical protein
MSEVFSILERISRSDALHLVSALRQVRSAEEVASIQSDFVKESLEHAVQHARTFIQMVVTLPPELVQPVNPAVDAAGAARHAAAARIERLSEVASKD